MNLVKSDFKNELGNDIALSIATVPVAPNYPTQVCIQIVGPSSTSENTLTLKEAKHLRDALTSVLK